MGAGEPLSIPATRRRGVHGHLPAHKTSRIRQAIESLGARLEYLPPYSPDFNPIENMWSKAKEALRSAAQRTIDTLGNAVANALTRVTSDDCRGFFSNSGYAK